MATSDEFDGYLAMLAKEYQLEDASLDLLLMLDAWQRDQMQMRRLSVGESFPVYDEWDSEVSYHEVEPGECIFMFGMSELAWWDSYPNGEEGHSFVRHFYTWKLACGFENQESWDWFLTADEIRTFNQVTPDE